MDMHHERLGAGRPLLLLLLHGLGSTWRTWDPVLAGLPAHREVIALDLPGFGATAPLEGEVTIARLADAVSGFVDAELHWFDSCGHFPMWDRPEETVELVLSRTGGTR